MSYMTKEEKKKALTQHLEEYEYLREGREPGFMGRFLDVELFCHTLSRCLTEDGVLSDYITPPHLYQFTFDVIERFRQRGYSPQFSQTVEKYVEYLRITDWENLSDADKDIYPDDTATQFHAALLAEPSFRSFWIYCIGSHLIRSPLAQGDLSDYDFVNKPTQYFAWIKPEWTFSFKFISGFHTACSDWLREFDKHCARKGGPSLMESLAISNQTGADYDTVSGRNKKRNEIYQNLLEEIQSSIKKESFRDAVTLEENLMTYCIKDFLKAKGATNKRDTFSILVKSVLKNAKKTKAIELFIEVDKWRKKRNKITHNHIEALMNNDNTVSLENTANEGLKICKDICDWYYEEASMYWNLYRDETEQLN